jgi:protein-tyrosine phosphatase
MQIALNLGSNIPPRMQYLRQGINRIHGLGKIKAYSSVYETQPILLQDDGGNFLNLSILLETALTPYELLIECKEIEGFVEKRTKGDYLSRRLDIDIVFSHELSIKGEKLSIPHKSLKQRSFFLLPLHEILPEAIDPETRLPYFSENMKTLSPPILRRFVFTTKPRRLDILVVCSGNICRSPFAEMVLKRMLPSQRVNVSSAGTLGIEGGTPLQTGIKQARIRGYDISRHSSRGITKDMLDNADLILVLDDSHYNYIKKRSPENLYRTRYLRGWEDEVEIPDPYGGDDEDYSVGYDEIVKSCEGLIDKINAMIPDLT